MGGAVRNKAKKDVSEAARQLKKLRVQIGYSVRQMAAHLDMESSSYQHYEDRFKRPYLPPEIVKAVAPLFAQKGVSQSEIDKLLPPISNVVKPKDGIVLAPIISWVQAGGLVDTASQLPIGEAEDHLPVHYGSDSVFVLRVRGRSMDRVAPDGSMILVDYSQKELESGRCYIIRVGEEMTFKKYQASPPCFVPDSSEAGHSIFLPEQGVEIVGRVVKVITEI
jgi:SOS-response transcriptional repressor LexA